MGRTDFLTMDDQIRKIRVDQIEMLNIQGL